MSFLNYLLCGLMSLIVCANTENDISPSSLCDNYPMFGEERKDQFLNLSNLEPMAKEKKEKVEIQVYYESFCYGSRRAIVEYLIPTMKKLGEHLDVLLYPYGLAKTFTRKDGSYEIQCQHGPLECYGNMLHACSLDLMKNYTAAIYFNACMMRFDQNRKGSDDEAVDKCGKLIGISPESIKCCAKSPKAIKLHKCYGELKKRLGYKVVPYVLINGVQYKFTRYYTDFIKAICETFENPPDKCKYF